MTNRIKYYFIGLAICFCQTVSVAQQNKIDSLQNVLQTTKEDTIKIITFNNLFLEFEFNNETKALDCLNKAIELSEKINYKYGLAITYNHLGFFAEDKRNYSEALKNYFSALKIREAIGDKKGGASSYNNIARIYYRQNNLPEALKCYLSALKKYEVIGDKKNIAYCYANSGVIYHKQGNIADALKSHFASLKIFEEIADNKSISFSFNNIGAVYETQGNYSEALKNHISSLKIRKAIGDKKGVANSYNNIGNVYDNMSNYPEALKNYFASLKICESIGDSLGIGGSYCNIGIVYKHIGNYSEALKNYFSGLKIMNQLGYKEGIAASFLNIGLLYTKQKKLKEAEIYLNKSKELSKEIGHIENVKNAYGALTELDSTKGNFKEAYENHKLYIIYRDSLDNEATRKKTIQSQMTYDFEKKEAVADAEHKKELENQNSLAEEKSRKQKVVLAFVGGGLFLVLVFAGFIFRSLRVTRKQKDIIEKQKGIVEHQKLLVEEHQKEIVDSIIYAKRIQYALLANKLLLENNLPEHFILFKPKDIVSGDFYWASKRDDKFYIAACDSTGHGVPGAFMSLLNISFLNEAVNEKNISEPNEILNHVRRRLIENMDDGQDGMDAILMCVDGNNITYAAANNSPSIIKNGKTISLPTDKMPVGKGERANSFTSYTIEFEKGDSLYLYTDGYADQFGGPKFKKFMYKQLNELILSISNLPVTEQSKILNTKFEDWKGNLEQVDDVLIIGAKL